MVRANSFYATKTTISGQQVDLEDVFDYLDKEVQDPEKTFEKMINLFKDTDENIIDKLESLKFKLSQERPDEFDYIPDNDYGPSSVKKKPDPPPCRVERGMPKLKAIKIFLMLLGIFIGLTIIAATLATCNMDLVKEKPTPSIRIEKLDPL